MLEDREFLEDALWVPDCCAGVVFLRVCVVVLFLYFQLAHVAPDKKRQDFETETANKGIE